MFNIDDEVYTTNYRGYKHKVMSLYFDGELKAVLKRIVPDGFAGQVYIVNTSTMSKKQTVTRQIAVNFGWSKETGLVASKELLNPALFPDSNKTDVSMQVEIE